MKERQEFIHMTTIPHFIVDASINYNKYILPIYLYIKRRTTENRMSYFSYNNLLNYYKNDSFNKRFIKEIITAIIFLTNGGTETKYNEYGDLIENNKIMNVFEIDNFNNILKKMIESVQIKINETNKEQQEWIIESTTDCPIDRLIVLIEKQLKDTSEVILYDNSKECTTGYIQIKTDILYLLDWYYLHQTNTNKKLDNNYVITNKEKLKTLEETLDINIITSRTKIISYITLINLYIYIYRICYINTKFKKKTYISSTTISKTMNISNTTAELYLTLFRYLGLLKTTEGSFQQKKVTSYTLIDKWKNTAENIYSKEIYKFTIIDKKDFLKIIECYNKKK